MASYWDRQAYEAKKNAAASQTSALTPEAPISFVGMAQLGGGVPTVGFNQAAYAAQQKSAGVPAPGKTPATPKPPKAPKVKQEYAADGTKIKAAPRDPTTMNRIGLKKYTSAKLGIKSTYSEPKNTETSVANSNTGRLGVPAGSGFKGKSSLVIKKY